MSLLPHNAKKVELVMAHRAKMERKKALRKSGTIVPGFDPSPRTSMKWAIRQLKELKRQARIAGVTPEQLLAEAR